MPSRQAPALTATGEPDMPRINNHDNSDDKVNDHGHDNDNRSDNMFLFYTVFILRYLLSEIGINAMLLNLQCMHAVISV